MLQAPVEVSSTADCSPVKHSGLSRVRTRTVTDRGFESRPEHQATASCLYEFGMQEPSESRPNNHSIMAAQDYVRRSRG